MLGISCAILFSISVIIITGAQEVDAAKKWNFGKDSSYDSKRGEYLTKPTFGLSHETNSPIVDNGFRINDKSFTINDNYHTPFPYQTVNIGEENSFEAKLYAEKKLRVQEFLFGIPKVGAAHLAELGV